VQPVRYWLRGIGNSEDQPDRSGLANETATFINRVSAAAASFGTNAYASFERNAYARLGTPALDLTTGQSSGQEGVNVVVLTPRDPWLVATWDLIADHHDLASGWDGMNAVAPKRESLDTAELLAILISSKPMRSRPQFSVDSSGRPSFALYDDRLYLHLTIDDADRLWWYAVFGDVESFEDDIVFDGAQLP
jgi:hypothetical protein